MDRYEFDFAVYECHKHYILAEPKEGALVGKRELSKVYAMIKKHYNAPFGFIGNRINPSATHLSIYEIIKKEHPLLQAVAVVSYRPITDMISETERILLRGIHFQLFHDLEAAKEWILETLLPKQLLQITKL